MASPNSAIHGAVALLSAPSGCLLLASWRAEQVGVVAIRRLREPACCELKRLFVLAPQRGRGVGRMLMEHAIAAAPRLGYARIRRDTLQRVTAANGLYASFGFSACEPHTVNPLPDAIFLEKTCVRSTSTTWRPKVACT